jgi:hypothetical protein
MKNLIAIYRRMRFMQKLQFWGALASIVGLAMVVIPFHVQSGDQTTHGSQSPNFNDTKGTINLHYNNSGSSPQKQHVLRSPYGKASIFSEPTSTFDQSNVICTALGGTPIRLLGETVSLSVIMEWEKVEITDGRCAGKVGWATTDNIRYE